MISRFRVGDIVRKTSCKKRIKGRVIRNSEYLDNIRVEWKYSENRYVESSHSDKELVFIMRGIDD